MDVQHNNKSEESPVKWGSRGIINELKVNSTTSFRIRIQSAFKLSELGPTFLYLSALCVAALKGSLQQDKPFCSVTAQLLKNYMCLQWVNNDFSSHYAVLGRLYLFYPLSDNNCYELLTSHMLKVFAVF